MRKIKKISKDDALLHITRTQTAVVVPVLLAFYFLKESAFISNSIIISILCLFIGVLVLWIVIKTTSHKYLGLKIGKFCYFVELTFIFATFIALLDTRIHDFFVGIFLILVLCFAAGRARLMLIQED